MKYIDLFAGIGGFHYGIDKAIKAECVYSNEWDKYANSVYRKHYGECDIKDIKTVRASDIPDFDLMCGGFPCQSFSIAGKRRGFEDTRGTLFFDMARIAKEKHPRLLLFENVKGLLSHDNGRTFATIIQTLDELGYDLQWQVCNSKNFKVPQNRERVFIIGHIRGTSRPKVFPITEGNGLHPNEITKEVSDAQRIYSIDGISKTLKGLGGGLGAKTGLYAISSSGRSWGRESRIKTGEANTINTGRGGDSQSSQNRVVQNMAIRRLTPIECERLQGFPDNWTKYGADGELISDTQRYKMAGNAVTTNVITEIARRLI